MLKNIRISLCLALCCWAWGSVLHAQVETDCNPDANLPVTQGEVFINYGSVTNSFTRTNRSDHTIGQPITGLISNQNNAMEFGIWSRLLVSPQAPMVFSSEGDFPDRVQIMWEMDPLSASATGGFIVQRDGAYLTDVDASTNQFIDFNVQAGELYEYAVIARNAFGNSARGTDIGFVNPNGTVSGRVLTPSGTPVVDAVVSLSPISGSSLLFDGVGDYLCVNYQDTLPTATWTLSAWVKIGATHDSDAIVDFGSDLNKNFWMHTTPSGEGKGVVVGVGNGTGSESVSHVFADSPDAWHYVTAVYGGGTLILYVDGQYIKAMNASISQGDARFTIGALRDQSGGFFDGHIDDVRLYGRMLTQTEIILSKDVTPSSNTDGLVAYWKFDEGAGSKTFDISGNGFHGQIYGATFSNDFPPIRNGGITDEAGFYTIESINYSQNQTFFARPAKLFYTSYALEFNASQESKATLTSFDLPDTATVELALLPFDRQSEQVVFSKLSGGQAAFQLGIDAGNYTLTINNEQKTVGVIPADYHHLAFTFNSRTNEVQPYLNGSAFGGVLTFANMASNWDDTPWCVGAAGSSNYYTGLIDEVAIFDTIVNAASIQLHAARVGDPDVIGVDAGDGNLFVYFPFNESKGVSVRDIGPQMTGAGTLSNATFSVNTLRPNTSPHLFSPAQRQVNINTSNTAVSQVDFTDRSTIKVNGVVRFEKTFCYQKEIEILVNGESHTPPIFTNNDGEWIAEFNPGDDVILTPVFEDHAFLPPFLEFRDIQTPIAGVLFQNTTKRTLVGAVLGGECNLPVVNEAASDRVIFELRSDNGCLVLRDTVTSASGKYEFKDVPPIQYAIGIAAGSSSAIFDYFEPRGGSPVDLRMVTRDTIDFNYFSNPVIEFSGLDNYTCEGGTMLDYPILNAGVPYQVKVRVYEPYVDVRCYLDSAAVQVTNDIEGTPQLQRAIAGGELNIRFKAGMPNFIAPYLKAFNVTMETADGRTANRSLSAAILGAQRLPGAVLPTNPPIYPFYILRDPPGDGSFATLEMGKKVCRTYGITTTFSNNEGLSVAIGNNASLFGLKAGSQKFTAEYEYQFSEEKGRETQLCVATTEVISTPESDEFVGSDGDTYIGAVLNLTYGSNRNLSIDETTCELSTMTDYSMELDGFQSDFIFTEKHILDVVIPQAETVGDEATANRWRQLVARNQRLKDAAQDPVLSVSVNEGNVPTNGNNLQMLTDRDGDGTPDADDEFPWSDDDFATSDNDMDGKMNDVDNCPMVHNPYQQNKDGDAMGDACDPDIDNDGIPNATDKCPYTADATNADANGDGIGDVCQTDYDNDGILDDVDYCPRVPSPGNADTDRDFIGDHCERDTDQDNIPDDTDDCPYLVGEDCDQGTELEEELTLGAIRKNITFGAGIVYESSWAQDTVTTISESELDDHTLGFELEVVLGDNEMGPLYGEVVGNVGFNWGHGEYESNNIENSTVVGFTLTDDDVGDFYTVDIKSDVRYKTPVFKLKGGDSSCPFEGADILRNRDQVNFSVEIPENSITNVGENDRAVVYLNVGNDSPTGQPRTYIVAPVQESNPNGAVIKIAGSLDPREVTVRAGEQLRLVTTIEKGPVEFEYDSIRIAMYAPCEYNAIDIINGDIDPRFYKEVAFDVQFVQGCPGVDITSPLEGWVVTDPNPATAKLEIQLSNYEETNLQLEEIRTQYRLVGGSGVWVNIDTLLRTELGPVDTRSNWFVGELSDGKYEIRAVTFCNSGLPPGSSDFVEGILERKPPELFGSPQPADGVLSPGDEISITFNEAIRCNEIFQADGVGSNINFNNLALFDVTTGRLVDATISCDGQKITIVPAIDNRFIENHTLRVITNEIKDLVGNRSAEIAWEFFVNRSNLYWEGGPIDEMIQEGSSAIITREIRNQGGQISEFTLTGIPSWMNVFPRTGSLAPGGRVIVNFEFPSDLFVDTYQTMVVMETIDGDENLDVKLRVNCEGPDWSFDASQYSFSMNLTLELDIEGTISNDRIDRIAAFVGGELRGLAYVEYAEQLDRYLAFLTVYSNAALGETVNFQIWDADICLLYGSTVESFPFEPDGLVGSPLAPQVIHTNNQLLRKIYIHPGWNWISYNIDLTDPSTNAALSSLTNPDGATIKGQTMFSSYAVLPNLPGAWYGSLNQLSHLTMYQYRSMSHDSLLLIGAPVNASTPMPIQVGWNWIGYLPQQGMPVTQALSSLTPLNGDLVKGQFQFAQYVAGVGWIGNLNFMSSPNGYLLRISNPGTLVYPDTGNLQPDDEGQALVAAAAPRNSPHQTYEQALRKVMLLNHWTVDPSDFEFSMNLIGIVDAGEAGNALSEGDEIAAFVDGEVRGTSQVVYVESLDSYMVFLTMYANQEGESLQFKWYDQSAQIEVPLVENFSFLVNALVGNVAEPFAFHTTTTSVAQAVDATAALTVFPNPAKDHVYFRFDANVNESIAIRVTDALGREVGRLTTEAVGVRHTLEWNTRHLAAGLYVVTLHRADGSQVRQMFQVSK